MLSWEQNNKSERIPKLGPIRPLFIKEHKREDVEEKQENQDNRMFWPEFWTLAKRN